MPLQQRIIEPVNVSRSTLPLPPGDIKPLIRTIPAATGQGLAANAAAAANINIVNELECVTNGTLANLIRQLSSLSRQAEELLTGVFDDASKILTRTIKLQQRMDSLSAKIEAIEQPSDAAIILRDPANQHETFSSDMTCDQQVLSKQQMPSSIAELYETCDQPPPLSKLDQYRDDGKDGLKFYTDPTYFFELWRKDMMKDTVKAQQQQESAATADVLYKYLQKATLNDQRSTHQQNIPTQITGSAIHQPPVSHYNYQTNSQQQLYQSPNIQQPVQQYQPPVVCTQTPQSSHPDIATPPPPPALSPLPPPTSPPPPPPSPPPVMMPPMPPAPPAPPAQPQPPVQQLAKVQLPTAAQLQQKQQQLRKTVPIQRDPRSDLLAAIKQGITLRRVEDSKRRVEAEKQQSMGNDVASILARRVAMQVSDSDENGDDDDTDNDWDNSSNR